MPNTHRVHRCRPAATVLILGFIVAMPVQAVVSIDAVWDIQGLQICGNASPIVFRVHATPMRLEYACSQPTLPLRTCFLEDVAQIDTGSRVVDVRCSTTAPPLPDPDRILHAGFEHRERKDF